MVMMVIDGKSDCVGGRNRDVGLLLDLDILQVHRTETSLATRTSQRRNMNNCCRWIRLNVVMPSENDG